MRIINKLLNFISKRVFVVGLIILVQLLWGISMLKKLTEYSSLLNMALAFLSLLAVLYIINKDDNPAYKLAWIIPILVFPLFGGFLYLLFGDKRPTKRMRIRMDKAAAKISVTENCCLQYSLHFNQIVRLSLRPYLCTNIHPLQISVTAKSGSTTQENRRIISLKNMALSVPIWA